MKKTILHFNLLIIGFVSLYILSFSETNAQTLIRPYAKVGYFIIAPIAEDLGHIVVNNPSESLDNLLEVQRETYGFGAQVLFPLSKSKGLKIGADLGYQSLYKWNVDMLKQPGGYISGVTMAIQYYSEKAIFLNGFVELSPKSSGLFAQAGLGLQMVLGTITDDMQSIYENRHEETTYNSVELGLLLSGGYSIPLSKKISLPLMIRIDQVFEYGFHPMISASVGLSTNL